MTGRLEAARAVAPVEPPRDEPSCALLVVGCGNLLRGEDGVGPILVRHLWEDGVPAGVRLVDGGTAGMDVAFQMRGAARVVIVDAATTGRARGTVYQVPGPALEDLPPLAGLHTHSFRWDHALAFGRWLLGEAYPDDVTVYLVEVGDFTPGAELSAEVRAGMEQVLRLIRSEPAFAGAGEAQVEFTADGYLRVPAAQASRYFPSQAAVVLAKPDEIWLVPLHGAASGGLLLKRRNARGDCSLLVREVLGDDAPLGVRPGRWDAAQGALRISRTAARG